MECRENCGACCIVPSISSAIPAMPQGKPAGLKCPHLMDDLKCAIFELPDRPAVCSGFKAEEIVCGLCQKDAFIILGELEGIKNPTELIP